MDKKGVSFGTIVATIGSILIAVGIAWLIAQNWHQIPSPIKISILIISTAAAYTAGVILKVKKYPGIGKSLMVLGALLYTLSIFLIAQIFSTSTTLQGTAWLLLLAWTGVVLSAYMLKSSPNLVIGLIEFLIWISIQFFAFGENSQGTSHSILAFYYLFTGILLYGLSLWHRKKGKTFAAVYQFWTAFYFLAFTYVLSFQILLPLIWSKSSLYPSNAMTLLAVFAVLSLAVFISGAVLNKKPVLKKEIIGMVIIVIILAVLIGITYFASDAVGQCRKLECFDFRSQEECSSSILNCQWQDNYCDTPSCYRMKNKGECENPADNFQCAWSENYGNGKYGKPVCLEKCDSLRDQNACEANGCFWFGENCGTKQCYNYQAKNECEISNLDCRWQFGSCAPSDICNDYNNKNIECEKNPQCKWQTGIYGPRDYKQIPYTIWATWIIINIAFISLILVVIAYGTWMKLSKIINLGIIFFALDIVTRYIGFIIDLQGYTSLSIIFITGGIILLLGGWGIEKWRRKLIKNIRH